jgi:hypothetical protein
VLVVVLWVPTLWVLPSGDTWQLVISTVTTIITFSLVALWDLMGELGDEHPEHCVGIVAKNWLMRSGAEP